MFEAIGLETFSQLIQSALVVVPLVTGLTEVVKRTFNLPARYIPATSTLIGAVTGLTIIDLSLAGGTAGVVMGLAAVGLWEVGKKSFKAEPQEPVQGV